MPAVNKKAVLAKVPEFIAEVAAGVGVNELKRKYSTSGEYGKTTVFEAYQIVKAQFEQNISAGAEEAAPVTAENAEEGTEMPQTVTISKQGMTPALKQVYDMVKPPKLELDQAICINITLRRPGTKKAVNLDEIETPEGADTTLLSMSKDILDSPELRKIRTLDVTIGNYLKQECLPGTRFFKSGTFLVPPGKVTEVDTALQTYFADRHVFKQEFKKNYPELKKAAQTRLGPLYNEAEYPDVDKIISAITEEVFYFSFSGAQALKQISSAIFEREEKKAQARVDKAIADIEATLGAAAKKTVDSLIDKLGGGDDGTPKVIKKAAVDKFKKFFADLKERNVTGNGSLTKIADTGIAALEGVDPEVLRKSDKLRDQILTQIETLKPLLDEALIPKPGRQLEFED